ncbi:MAG: hypothetical protein LQ347_004224 [Umbilicaria vellea]|nr:MAG: hypothetical protein LQ347_004224 [Umbilicaria vellea]
MLGIIISVVGALISSAFTIAAAYYWSRSVALSLPVPALANFLATTLPLFTYLSLLLSLRPSKPSTRFLPIETLALLPGLDTILITLASSQLPGDALTCALDSRWRALFLAKNSRAIRSVQDRFECCGFVTAVDKAWPFPDREHGADACVLAFNRAKSCLTSWKKEERTVLAVMITVGAVSLVGKLLLFLLVRWRPQLFGEYAADIWQSRGRQDQRAERRMITGQDGVLETERLYFDEPAGEAVLAERASGDGEERGREIV